jgi:FlaA1/EpsC-like NDP-sugar epimerase
MVRMPNFNVRRTLIVLHDLVATAAAILAAFYIRFEEWGLALRIEWLIILLPGFLVYAGIVYSFFHLYKGKWRFASLPDLHNIFQASTVLALSLLVLDYILVAPNVLGGFFFGKLTIILYWFLQMFFLGGPRIAYRSFRRWRTQRHAQAAEAIATLILGRAGDADVLLRAIESGAVKKIWPLAILSPSAADQGQSLRGVPVLGGVDRLEQVVGEFEARGNRIKRIVLTPTALEPDAHPEAALMSARRLAIPTSRLPSLEGEVEPIRLAPIEVEDLLVRPTAKIDYERIESFMRGKSVVVTGGGGSIGAEICDRVVAFGAQRLLVLENSEPALHAVIEKLALLAQATRIEARLADIRDRERIFRLIAGFRPDLVFHAAALKHVPILERDWSEAAKTNVLGSVNVADAAVAAGAAAMVMISTDKAIEPVSVLGVSKRFAEMYCQALDIDLSGRAAGERSPMRIISVRFGNVLASNGSVVPKFKAQIEAGGPVTVTHPEMVRYFMTIREASDLVITAASHALGPRRTGVSVYVLNMGQPVKIVDLAERMIRLAGLEPGRDVDIVFTGIRPGERLNEILFAREEPTSEIGLVGILAAKPVYFPLETMRAWTEKLARALAGNEQETVFAVLRAAVPDFRNDTGCAAKADTVSAAAD